MRWKRSKLAWILGLASLNFIAIGVAWAGFVNYPGPDCTYPITDPITGVSHPVTFYYPRCAYVGYFSGLGNPGGFPSVGGNGHHETGVLPDTYNYNDPSVAAAGGTLMGPWAFPSNINNCESPATGACNNQASDVIAATNFINYINSLLRAPIPVNARTGRSLGCTINNPNLGNAPGEDFWQVQRDFIQDGVTHNYVVDASGALVGYPNQGCWGWRREKLGAAFIVLTMLGDNGLGHGNSDINGVNAAIARFGAWSALVTRAAQDGDVDWDVTQRQGPNFLDSTSEDYGHDVAVFINTGPFNLMSIVFTSRNAAGNVIGHYIINRSCGNTDGPFVPLSVPAGFNMALTAAPVGSTTLAPGDTGTISMTLTDSNGPSTPGSLQIQQPVNCATDCSSPVQIPLGFGDNGDGFSPTSTTPGYPGPNWFWKTISFSAGNTSSGRFTFVVPPGAHAGDILTFVVDYYPSNPSGAVQHIPVTFSISRQSYPSVVGLGSDIHAGGAICSQAPSVGNIHTNTNAQSYGQYVVSSYGTAPNGAITNLGSNNSRTSSQLSLSQYTDVCRLDLYQLAIAANTTHAHSPSSPIDLSLPTPIPGSITVDGKTIVFVSGNVNIHGALNLSALGSAHTLTIVADHDVNITGDITLPGGTTGRGDIPSVGIIAGGNINIEDTTHRVDAYLISDQNINTCDYTGPNTCNSTLTVNGFLMANSLSLGRIGPLGSNGPVHGETITMNPELYLNPPAYLDNSLDTISLFGQGERPPLF